MCDKSEIEGTQQTAQGRGTRDRPGDPLFPLMPKVLETLRARAAERAQTEGREAAPQEEYAMIVETICGAADDSQAVELYNGTLGVTQAFVSGHERSVGQIQWNDNLASIYTNPGTVNSARWCSGTLISNDLFITAGHCFDQTGGGWERPRINGTSNIISTSDIAKNMHVNFNYQVDPMGNPRPVSVFAITQLVEYRLGGLDFAIVRLAGNPGATWGRTTVSTTDAAAGDMLCILGHPAGVPKRIEAGPALAPAGDQIRYDDIDTLGGNSGSGVLRASDGRIVGVHTNGGCGASSPNGTDFNFGQRIVSVINASPTLRSLTRPTTKPADDVVATTKSADDIHVGTIKAIDDGATIASLDQIGTRKGFDDVKTPALDKPWSDVKRPGSDGFPWANPGGPLVNPGGPFTRPFALGIPHHTMAWTGETPGAAGAEAYEAALAQLGEVIAQHQQALTTLEAEYRAILAEYQQAAGMRSG